MAASNSEAHLTMDSAPLGTPDAPLFGPDRSAPYPTSLAYTNMAFLNYPSLYVSSPAPPDGPVHAHRSVNFNAYDAPSSAALGTSFPVCYSVHEAYSAGAYGNLNLAEDGPSL